MRNHPSIFRPAVVSDPAAFRRQQLTDAQREARSRKVVEIVTLGLVFAFCIMSVWALVVVSPAAAIAISDWMVAQ